jgi:hypothetical protein
MHLASDGIGQSRGSQNASYQNKIVLQNDVLYTRPYERHFSWSSTPARVREAALWAVLRRAGRARQRPIFNQSEKSAQVLFVR